MPDETIDSGLIATIRENLEGALVAAIREHRGRVEGGPQGSSRQLVGIFAQEMEKRLLRNDAKPPWKQDGEVHLINLCQSVGRLMQLLLMHAAAGVGVDPAVERKCSNPVEIRHVTADVANFAMILSDLAGVWPEHDGRGRVVKGLEESEWLRD